MRKIRKAKVLNNGSPLISDSLINVPTSSRGNIVAHCNFAFSDETLTRTITTLNLLLSCLFCSSITDSFKTPINISFNPFCCVQVNRRGVAFRLACVLLLNIHP